MKISTKGRYGIAAMICLAESGKSLAAVQIAKKLNVSKIYLEQIFTLLKKAELIQSSKGAAGGYYLKEGAEKITAYEILKAVESGLFEPTEPSFGKDAAPIEEALEALIWTPLDRAIQETLSNVTLEQIVQHYSDPQQLMFWI